jgi:hypothetical protein
MSALSVMTDKEFTRYANKHADNALVADDIETETARRKQVAIDFNAMALVTAKQALVELGLDSLTERELLTAYIHIKSPMDWYGVSELPAFLAAYKTALHDYLKLSGYKLDAESVRAELAK